MKTADPKAALIQWGIELETRLPATSQVAVGSYHSGYPVTTGRTTAGARSNAPAFNTDTWKAERDGSIRCDAGQVPCEFVSPILHGVEGIENLCRFMEWINAIGATVDTGNSFALLDDPYGAIEALAPYAFTVHFKDQALREYEHGFLLADIPLGQGSFDMQRVAAILRRAKPDIRMMLELITRDPLKVPCLSEKFWATMPQVSGNDLARTLRFVREHPAKSLQEVGSLSLDKQVELEDANIAASVKYAREELDL